MRELKASTKQGKAMIARARVNEGRTLSDVYGCHSVEKEHAYDYCVSMYNKTTGAHDFHICSRNTFQFSVAWEGFKDGERILRLETRDNSYLIWLDR